jgi:phosphoribosylanthranilate isomerase
MPWIKICGITNLEDARVAVDAGADALGFVFYQKSPRRVDAETVKDIVAKLPAKVEKVGVFVDDPLDEVAKTAREAALTAVQVSGESALGRLEAWLHEECGNVENLKLVPSVPASHLANGGVHIAEELRKHLLGVLIDSASKGQPGGTGEVFDWQAARQMITMLGMTFPVIVAGGLNPANVGDAIRLFQPFGVDVASGVEARPGKKDPAKVRAFVQAAREAGRKQ